MKIVSPKPSEVAMAMIHKVLWDKLPRKSIVSGLWLRSYEHTLLFPNCFLHVLPDKQYHYMKYYFKNIVLVTPGEAGLWVQGSEEERILYALRFEEESKGKCTADWDVLKILETELKLEYQKYFPKTKGGLINYNYSREEITKFIGSLNKKFIFNLK